MRGGTVNVALNTDDIGRKLDFISARRARRPARSRDLHLLRGPVDPPWRRHRARHGRRLAPQVTVRDPGPRPGQMVIGANHNAAWSGSSPSCPTTRCASSSSGKRRSPASRNTSISAHCSDEVVLFSGGLNSLAGAVDRLAHGDGTAAARKSPVGDEDRQPAARPRPGTQPPISQPGTAHPRNGAHSRRAARARRPSARDSLLFGALAAAVARTSGVSRFNLFENGVVSINLPIASQVVGAAASRTTHPRVLRDLADFLTALVGHPMGVENPYLWNTKAEVIEILRAAGHADLVKDTVSCSRVHEMTRLHTHCGRCSQCLDRRFATLGAGIGPADPAEMYGVDLLADARDDPLDVTMAEAFVRHALELEGLSAVGFMGRFGGEIARIASCVPGMSADAVAQRDDGATPSTRSQRAARPGARLPGPRPRLGGAIAAAVVPAPLGGGDPASRRHDQLSGGIGGADGGQRDFRRSSADADIVGRQVAPRRPRGRANVGGTERLRSPTPADPGGR